MVERKANSIVQNKLKSFNFISNTTSIKPYVAHSTKNVIAKADTGASKHYFKPTDATVITNVTPTTTSPEIQLPNNTTISATHIGTLPLSTKLTKQAQQVQILPQLSHTSLLSIGQLCDDNCIALFSKYALKIFKQK